jgi:hypothetical protein
VIATAAATVDVWDLQSGARSRRLQPTGALDRPVKNVVLSRDERVVVFHYGDGLFESFEADGLQTRGVVRAVEEREVFLYAGFSRDGTIFGIAKDAIVWLEPDGTEITRRALSKVLRGHGGRFERTDVEQDPALAAAWEGPKGVPENSPDEPRHGSWQGLAVAGDASSGVVLQREGEEDVVLASFEKFKVQNGLKNCYAQRGGNRIAAWCLFPRASTAIYDLDTKEVRNLLFGWYEARELSPDGRVLITVAVGGGLASVDIDAALKEQRR